MTLRWPSNQSPVWRYGGLALVAVAAGATVLFVGRGPRPLRATSDRALFDEGAKGLKGTLTEAFGRGRLVLAYASIQGEREDLQLETIQGRLEEDASLWLIEAPRAERQGGVWTLSGPVALQAIADGNRSLGTGSIQGPGPALRWSGGTWQGLGALAWTDLEGRGRWTVPAGWTRDASGRIRAAGPVRWSGLDPNPLQRIEAGAVEGDAGFQTGRLRSVAAAFEAGTVQAPEALLEPAWIRWPAGLTFQRTDGWAGSASGGRAPRGEDSRPEGMLELQTLEAERLLPQGRERLRSRGARWVPGGWLLEGDVAWEQPLEEGLGKLVAPRIVIRTAEGGGLPPDLPVGQGRAEGQAVLTWGRRSLGSPRIGVDRSKGTWSMAAPVLGRSEEGSFSAGAGRGTAKSWSFDGPVEASFFNGGTLAGQRLAWEGETWVLTGRPVVWNRLQERLTGPRVLRTGERVVFPDGLAGQVRAPEGDLSLRADRGESEGDRITLRGHVECDGLGWQVAADTLTVQFGRGRTPRLVQARGSVTLRGRMGEGRGESLDVDPVSQSVRWQGRVRGLSEDLAR
jgi:hypothetical protein